MHNRLRPSNMLLRLALSVILLGLVVAQTKVIQQMPHTIQFVCSDDVKRDDYFDALGTGKKEWRLAFRGTPNIGKSLYQAFVDGTGVPTNHERNCMQLNTSLPCFNHYRNNRVLDKWENIDEVAFVVYKNNIRVQHVVFDADGTSYMDWFQQSKVKSSSWVDLKTGSFNFFSIAGVTTINYTRRFYINRNHGGCPEDRGWFAVIDQVGTYCSWERSDSFPVFRYMASNHVDNWTTGATGIADFIAVFVKYYSE